MGLSYPMRKQPPWVSKGSELQAQLSVIQEDLKHAKEKLVLVEKEKVQAIKELKEAQRLAEEANEKLREAVVAQKRAKENSEIEKLRAVEMEHAKKELEAVNNQHALDVTALLFATQELQRIKQELAIIAMQRTKSSAMLITQRRLLRFMLRRWRFYLLKNNVLVSELNSEIEILNRELEKFKSYEDKLVEKEASIEVELEAAKMTESYARNLVEELKEKVEDLEVQAEKANSFERSASESLESIMKQLEGSNDLLHDAESEIDSLKEKMGLLEISVGRQRGDLEESERRLDMAKEEVAEMAKKVESLKSELETVKEDKTRALNNEKLVDDNLINELENSRDEDEKGKKAMESLAAALHEVSSEVRESKEKLKYKTMLDDAKYEIDVLINSIEQSKNEYQSFKAGWEQKELHLMNCIKQSEDENSSMEKEISRQVKLLKDAEGEASATKEEGAQLEKTLKEVGDLVKAVVPFMGESTSDGTLAKFLKNPGDRVEVDEPIAQIETDKVTIDVASPEAGVIQKFVAKEGDTVEPGTKIAVISKCGEGVAHVAPSEKTTDKAASQPPHAELSEEDKQKPKVESTAVIEKPKSTSTAPPKRSATEPQLPPKERERRVPMTRLRKRVATRLKDSQNTFALLTTFNEVDMRIKDIIVQYKGSLVLELQQRSIEFSSVIQKHQNIRSLLVEKMPVLDEATYSGRRAGSLPATVSTSNGAAINLPNGVAKPSAAPLVDLLDLSLDDALVPSSSGGDFRQDLLRYLDENKMLILAILENQNLGKLTECAQLSVTIPTVNNNALGYGAFLGIYANLRYQLLCGIDKAMINCFDVIGVPLFFSTALRIVNVQLGETSRLAWLGVEVDPLAQSDDILKAYNRPSEPASQPSSNWFITKNAIVSGLGLLGIKQGQGDSVADEGEASPPKARRKRVVRRKLTTSSA
ncbi:putative WEB family protein [Camellia lanceoleosa]|uniref:WEB family protein n=1 Tax=Camellia lanceoleosa TaxID=1840588 RepID=A0ACC0H5Y2_9ERIC|nr:putative WEB family protein [Camellia lanceoleosa]